MKFFTMAIICIAFCNQALADLLVTPSRISFDKRDRTKEVILLNTSDERKSYIVEWITQSQGAGGAYTLVEDQSTIDRFPTAQEFIRFSPRRVTLEPGENQKVKLMVRRKNNMNIPEYRSHLKFTALPNGISGANDTPSDSSGTPELPEDGVSIKLNLLLSYSIPVVLRTEDIQSDVSFEEFNYLTKPNGEISSVNFTINKPFPLSVYGDFKVIHELNGERKDVGFLNGVNIFAENDRFSRIIEFVDPLPSNQGSLHIEYKGRAEFSNRMLIESSLTIK